MTVAYRWTCQVCGASNAPAVACAQCRFPAEATAEDIELAKAQGVDSYFQQREKSKRDKAKWLAQPLWRKVSDVVALTVLIVGLVLVRFAGPIEYNVAGVVLFALPLVWLWSAHRWRVERK